MTEFNSVHIVEPQTLVSGINNAIKIATNIKKTLSEDGHEQYNISLFDGKTITVVMAYFTQVYFGNNLILETDSDDFTKNIVKRCEAHIKNPLTSEQVLAMKYFHTMGLIR